MAIGDTVQAGLMRVDSSAIERTGQANARAYGQMFSTLGKIAGDSIEKYAEGKRKKEEQDELIKGTKAFIMGNPELGKMLNIQATDDISYEEAVNQAVPSLIKNPKGLETFKGLTAMAMDQQKAQQATELFNLRKSEILRSRRDKDLAQSDEQAIARFRTTRPDLPITKDTPASSLPPLDPDPFAAPPTTFKGQAPAVAQLPKSFQLEGKGIIDAVQSGRLSRTQGNRIMDSIQARAMAEQKAAPSLIDILNIQGKTLDMNIKAEDFGQKQDAISFKPEQNYLNLGEVKYGISGKFGNEAEVIKIKSEAIPNYQKMNEVMEDLIDLGEARKKQKYMSNSDKVLAESLSRQLQGLLREDILGPGTVTEPERAILEQIIQNPTQWFDFKGKTDDKIRSLKGVRKKAFNTLKSRLSGLGLDVSEFEQGGNASGTNKSPNMQNKTDSGLGYEFVPLDEL